MRDAARHDLRVLLRVVEVLADLRERLLVDHRAHEVPEVGDVAHLDLFHHRDGAIAHFGPERLRHVDAARRRALLPLVLEPAARDRDGELLRIGRRMRDDEVLAARFADDARIAAIAADVRADRLPHAVEDARAAGEVHAGEIRRVEQRVARSRADRRERS